MAHPWQGLQLSVAGWDLAAMQRDQHLWEEERKGR